MYQVDDDVLKNKSIYIYIVPASILNDNCYSDPLQALKSALDIKRNSKYKNISFYVNRLLDSHDLVFVMKTKLEYKLFNWADNEYKKLSKCKQCGQVLSREDNKNNIQHDNLFCGNDCRSESEAASQKLNDEEEHEFYL